MRFRSTRCWTTLLGAVVLVAATLPVALGSAGAAAPTTDDQPQLLAKGAFPDNLRPMVEVRTQSAQLTVRPVGQPSSLDLSDQIASASINTDIFSSVNGRAWTVTATLTMRAPVVDYDDSPPDILGIGLGQGNADSCVLDTMATGPAAYEATTYTFKGYVADGTPTPPPANVWTCAVAFSMNDVNYDNLANDPALDQVQGALTNVLGSEALSIPALGKVKLVKGAWTPLNVPVVNNGNVTARNITLGARATGAKVRVRRSLPTLDVGETNLVPVDVKLTSNRGKVTFDARSGDGVGSNQQSLGVAKGKAPKKPMVGKFQATRGSNASWRIDRKRNLKNFKVDVDLFCDGSLTPIPGTYRLPKIKVPRHGVVSKSFKDGIFTSQLSLIIVGDEVPFGYFVRYSEGAVTGQPACTGEASFAAKWVGR